MRLLEEKLNIRWRKKKKKEFYYYYSDTKLQFCMITVAKSTPRFYFYKKSDVWKK